jgi:hypothetical protein
MFSWLDFTIPGFTQRAQWLRSGRGVKTFDCIGLISGFRAADAAKTFSAAGRCVFFLRDRRVKTLHSLKFIRYSMYPVL